MLVELTAAGRRTWRRLASVMDEIQATLLAPLNAEEAALLSALLSRLGEPDDSAELGDGHA